MACQTEQPVESDQKPPNIIFILTDDMGYGDIGVIYQNQRAEEGKPYHKTPYLDKFASEGIMLDRHYASAPVCAPARASLLQGVHQGHANVRDNQFDKALSDNHNLATILKEAGYATSIVGKWGLQGLDGDSPETWEAYPTKRGFDHFFGYVRHVDGHNHYPAHRVASRSPSEVYYGDREISDHLRGVYTTDLFTAGAKKWIVDHRINNTEQPFFLYLAYDTPHAGLEVAPSPYPEGKGIDGGMQWIGERDNFINAADPDIDSYIHPDYADMDWPFTQKKSASMMRRIDNGIGDIMQLLVDLDIDRETIVIFSSDNGPHNESYGYGDYEPNFFNSFGPLEGIKRDTWEGGIRVPTIIRWPGRIPEGIIDDTPTGFHDWLPTFAELAGLPAPARADGISLVPMLKGEGDQHEGVVYVEHQGRGRTPDYPEFHPSRRNQVREQMQVVYLDDYKGIRYNVLSADDDFHIFDTIEDPGEINDLAESNDYFIDLQQRMKNKVLRIRRPDTSAVRPYDDVPVPAVNNSLTLESGVHFQIFEEETPWVPDFRTLQSSPVRSGISESFDLNIRTRDENIVAVYNGYLEIPETGDYTFYLQTDRGAVFRIHGSTVIDADRKYDHGSVISSEIRLEKGFHPVLFTYSHGTEGAPRLQLQWSGPGFNQKKLNSERFFHESM